MGTSHKYLEPFNISLARRSDEDLDDVEIDWERVFRLVPKLQRLDLTGVPMHSIHLRNILLAASASCHEMKALALPQREWHRGPVTSQWQPTIDTLYTALERWHYSTPTNGLVQLTLPQRVVKTENNQADFHALTDTYLRVVARFCPNIEYFDGWKMSYTEDAGRVHCQELLYCSRPAWEAFCGSCTQLREVNWFVLPFIDDFFEVFAADHKPKLEKLTLTAGDHEDFPDTVMLGHYSRMDDGKRRQTAWAKCSSAVPTFDVVFDDTALIALAKHCRSLEKLQIEWLQSPDGVLIHDVTDADITAIASLASLRSIQLKSTACGLPGVLELLRHAPTEGALREVEMFTGETKGVQIDSFHKRAISLFQALMSEAPDSERRRFCLTITGHVNLRKPETSKNRDGMKTLVHEVGVALPWLAVSIKESRTITTIVTQSHAHHPLLLHRQSSQSCALNACNMGPSEPTGSWRPLGSYLWQVLG